ncbi:uncharacterized protein LOC117104374 [Anneissia japonica]|uniref:uncharacterized protein LOC117104374 n=1 Tax=Anneissia japonica TaxID=1529436 RepID=UPI001425B75D|nr:uncharacterized protein LOC117104374 [Anneissia japonica]
MKSLSIYEVTLLLCLIPSLWVQVYTNNDDWVLHINDYFLHQLIQENEKPTLKETTQSVLMKILDVHAIDAELVDLQKLSKTMTYKVQKVNQGFLKAKRSGGKTRTNFEEKLRNNETVFILGTAENRLEHEKRTKRRRVNGKKNRRAKRRRMDDSDVSVDRLVYVKDKFCISDKGFHELSASTSSFPTLFSVRRRMNELNETFTVKVHKELKVVSQPLEEKIYLALSQIEALNEGHKLINNETMYIKITGDGTLFGHHYNVTNIGLSMYTDTMQSPEYVLIIAEVPEKYDQLKPVFSEIISTMTNLKTVEYNGIKLNIHYVFCADMKFVNEMMGVIY